MELTHSELQDYFESLTDDERQDLASRSCANCGGCGIYTAEDTQGNDQDVYCSCLVDGIIKKEGELDEK